jgi:signal transduction histidine kinase
MSLKEITRDLTSIGLTDYTPGPEAERVRLLNSLAIIASFFSMLFGFLVWIWGNMELGLTVLGMSLGYMAILVLNYRQKFEVGFYFYLFFGGITLLLLAYLFGEKLNAHLFYMHQIIMTAFVLRKTHTQYVFYLLFALFGAGCLLLYFYSTPAFPLLEGDWVSAAVYILAFLALIVYLDYFNRRIRNREQQIQILLQETQQKNQQLEQSQKSISLLNETLEEQVQERTLALERSNHELKRSNQDLEQFAYAASHDLQEPLRMMSNFSGLLERRIKDKLDEDARSYLHFIKDAVARMREQIKGLLTYSRVGQSDTPYEAVNLNQLVKDKLQDLRQIIQDKNAVVEIGSLPESLHCDPGQMGILFFNLIHNGLKFNHNPKPKIRVQATEEDEDWLIMVADNGIGIPQEYKSQVFEIFRRLHNREEFKGTGIGLSLCRKIVERHTGEIWLTSTENKGTTFYIRLPKLPVATLV